MAILYGVLGAALIAIVLGDAFETIVLPLSRDFDP